jgi:nitroimidazol reductase NimA-like FMN-containing flavoprotein (pyridoxamine 5'-phosphate oxidase superfamily)
MVSFSEEELKFILSNEVCRLATVSKDGKPHVVPVCYIYANNAFYIKMKPRPLGRGCKHLNILKEIFY